MAIIKNFSNENVIKENIPSIFLAGPTTRENKLTQWRIEACDYLNEIFGGIVYIPEYQDGIFNHSNVEKQCLWEREALEYANCILFWIPRNLKEGMPAFTTNVEFGTYLQRKEKQIVYGHPETAEKVQYLDWLYKYEKGPEAIIHTDLKSTLETAIKVAEWNFSI